MFRNFVKKRVTVNHLKNLSEPKKKHSKSQFLDCKKLQMAEYIKNSTFSTAEKRLLFRLRSQTLDVKKNFPGLNRNMWCRSCGLFTETQSHLLQCPALVVHLKYLTGKTSNLNEQYIYGNIKQQQMLVKIYTDILEVRESQENLEK